MNRPTEHPPAFRDGKIRRRSLLDLLLDEIARELERRRGDLPDTPWSAAHVLLEDVARLCFEVASHPTLRRRLLHLEAEVSRLWLSPIDFVAWSRDRAPVTEGRRAAFHPRSRGRIDGPRHELRESATGLARVSPDTVEILVPTTTPRIVAELGPDHFPAGTLVREDEARTGVGRFEITRFVEASP